MNKHLVAMLSVILILTGYSFAYSGSWSLPAGGTGSEYANCGQQTSDGGYIVAGYAASFGAGGNDVWVLKLNANGSVAWQKTYGEAGNDYANSVQQTTDGGYIVAGYSTSFGAGDTDVWILKLDATGSVVWQNRYGGTEHDYANAIQQTADGGYIVAGDTLSFGAGSPDAWVLKLNADGSVAWQDRYGGTGSDYAKAIHQTADGGYIVAGYTDSFGAGSGDAWVLKLNASGSVVWQKTYGGAGHDRTTSVQQTEDGGYIVAGYTLSFGAGSADAWVLKLNANGSVAWQKTYGGTGIDTAYSVRLTADGGYIVAGYTASFGAGSNDAWLLKLNADGGVAWQKTYGGSGADAASTIQQTGDGGYIVAGYAGSFGAGNNDAWMLKLDLNGNILGCSAVTIAASNATITTTAVTPVDSGAASAVTTASASQTAVTGVNSAATATKNCSYDPSPAQWQKTYGGTGHDYAHSVQQTSDGGYIVAGDTRSFGAGITTDAWVFKLNADGSVAWQKTYGGTGDDEIHDIQQTADGGYIAAGYSTSSGAGGEDAWVLKLNSDGSVAWQNTYGGADRDSASSVLQTTDGGYIVAGTSFSSTYARYDFLVLKLNADGSVAWQKTYGDGSGSDEFALSVQQTADGGYIVAGNTSSGNSALVLKLNADGSVAWQKAYGGTGDDIANSIQQTADGGYIVAGQTNAFGAGYFDVWILKLNTDGSVAWQKTYGGTANDIADSIQQTADGGYIVAGITYSSGGASSDAWVLKLNADGSVAWQKTYGGTDYDRASSIRQTADGGYIVAGHTKSSGAGGYDFWVLKLDQNGGITGCGTIADSTVTPSNTSISATEYIFLPFPSTASASNATATMSNTAVTPGGGCNASYFQYSLVVDTAGTGSGSVTSSPSGITCGVYCSQAFTSGTSVTLTAAPAAGSAFSGWAGGLCSGTETCTIVMTSEKMVTATFTNTPTLTVSKIGTGTVTSTPPAISCGGTCASPFNFGASVILSAVPNSGFAFAGWGDACTGTGTCTVVMNAMKSVSAFFYQPEQTSTSVELICPASAIKNTALNVAAKAHNQTCGIPFIFTKAKAMLMGNAGGTLSGIGIYGPRQTALTPLPVPAATCNGTLSEVVSGQVNIPVVSSVNASLAGTAGQVLVDLMTADGRVVASGECMIPVAP